MHNYLTRDGTPPAQLLEAGRLEVTGYGGQVEKGRVTAAAGVWAAANLNADLVTEDTDHAVAALRRGEPSPPGAVE